MRNNNRYVILFTLAVCVTCSLVVSGAVTLLKDRQERNARLDRQKNILLSLGILERGKKIKAEQIESAFHNAVEGAVIDRQGNLIAGKKPAEIPEGDKTLLPVYINKVEGRVSGYSFPISGKGLWSTIYGYLALEADGLTVKGIAFYKHGETPGLGGEIEKDWFLNNFKGKKILSPTGELVSIRVVKGKAAESVSPDNLAHAVDGISGATMTGNGVTKFLKYNLNEYEPYFKKVRAGI